MKYLFLFVLILLFSCNLKQNNADTYSVWQISDSLISNSSEDEINIEEYQAFYDKYFNNYSFQGIKIFQLMSYNESDYSKQLLHIMDTISGLFYIDGEYKLKKCWIEKVNLYENECYGGNMLEPTLNAKDNCLYLFRGMNKFSDKSILDTVSANFSLLVNEKKDFVFGDVSYQLRAEGKILNSDDKDIFLWDRIKGYKLYLTCGNKTQCITEMKKFSDTTTEITWIGDLDGDNKPDFVINSPEWYEDYRILLFLSSFSEEGELVKLVSITVDSFAC